MLVKMISNRLDAITSPVRSELRLAQEQAFERIQQVISTAEKEIAREGRFLTAEQRFQKAIKELEKAEEQMLSALGSIVKAIWYVAPQDNPFIDISPLKEIKGSVLEQDKNTPAKMKLGFFSRKKLLE